MRVNINHLLTCFVAVVIAVAVTADVVARGGGGGRGGGGFSGGGARGGGGGGMSRPSGGMSRPSGGMSRPSMPSTNRPSFANAGGGSRPNFSPPANISRPSMPSGSRPSLGGGGAGISSPGGGNIARPSLPSAGTRPSVRPPGALNPSTRPSPGGGGFDRPGIGGGDGPTLGNVTRPGAGGGGVQWPGGSRPGGGGGGIGPDRPGGGGRPDRPIIGGGGDGRPGRPGGGGNVVIGGGNNIIGGGNNIGSGNWGINNRPGGDSWSQNHSNWHDNWHDHCINDHHGWYNGCWNNHWGNNWYAPLAWGAVGWGLGSWYGGGSYYNPYYDASVVTAVPYDYSQPVVVATYDATAPASTTQSATPPPPQNDAALKQFDQGMADFKAGSYRQALTRFDAALKQLPGDPVVHEVRALAQFALGDYKSSAAGLNSLLATAPGMDWTTMASLYGNVDDYTQQLRRLEQHCKANPSDASAFFVLAYQYLVTGHSEEATKALRVVVQAQPKDATAKRMLESLAPVQPATATTAAAPPPTTATSPGVSAPQTDLVGSWQAKSGGSSIDLTIGEDGQFTWKAAQMGKPAASLQGELIATSDTLVLESKEQGSMVGRVKSAGPDKWQFAIAGSPPDDAGLSFERIKR